MLIYRNTLSQNPIDLPTPYACYGIFERALVKTAVRSTSTSCYLRSLLLLLCFVVSYYCAIVVSCRQAFDGLSIICVYLCFLEIDGMVIILVTAVVLESTSNCLLKNRNHIEM